MASQPTKASDRLDGALWLTALLLLWLVPIGRVSGDGAAYAAKITAGIWLWNPNHLLFGPAGAAWCHLLAMLGSTRPPVDQLKMLSILAGAVGAGLFRTALAPRLAPRRWAANHATAWLVLAAAPAHQLLDDEYHMIQMPLLVGLAAALPYCLERGGFRRSLAAGALAGGAALCMISNALLGVTAAAALGAWHLAQGERRAAGRTAAGVLAGLLLAGGSGLGAAWWLSHPDKPPAAWLLSYAGGAAPPRGIASYGTRGTAAGIADAATRTAYGAAKAAVDLGPAVTAVRDERRPGRAVPIILAWLAAAAALAGGLSQALRLRREPAARNALLLQAVWWPAVLAFGLFWNDSSDQFYFQLAVPFAALAALLPGTRRRLRVDDVNVPKWALSINDYAPLKVSIGSAPQPPSPAPQGSPSSRLDAVHAATSAASSGRPAPRPPVPATGWLASALLLCSAAALLWNGADVVRRVVLYPRAAWTADLLRELAGAGLVVTPGYDDAAILLYLAAPHPAIPHLSLTTIAVEEPAAQGLPQLAAAIQRSLAAARRVDLIDIWDAAPEQSPWKYLRRLGYDRDALLATLRPLGPLGPLSVDARPRAAGPFLIRSIRPAPAGAPPQRPRTARRE
jgi:hypothetical protein